MTARRRLLLLAAAAVALPRAARAQTQPISVEQVWARETAGGGHTGAVYLTLRAHGAPDRLTGASSPRAGSAMLHESYEDHGIARMRMLDGVDLPAGKEVTLKPGGMHIMLTGLKQPLVRGTFFPLTLTFGKAPPMTIKVPVLAAGAGMPTGEAMPGMNMQQ